MTTDSFFIQHLYIINVDLWTETGKNLKKVFGERSFKCYILAGARMDKAKHSRVQALTLKPLFGRGRAVDSVAEQGVTDVRHMYANLVGASCLKAAADVRKRGICMQKLPVRDGVFCVFVRHRHAFAVNAVAADGLIHGAGRLFESAVDNGLVHAVKAVVGKLQ